MKTIIFLFLCVFTFRLGNAQIIVTSADMPVANQSFILSTNIPGLGSVINADTGAGKTWDFSYLTPLSQAQDTFFGKNSMPAIYRSFLSTSSICEKTPDISLGSYTLTNAYNIYKSTTSDFEQTAGVGELNSI